MLALWGHSKFQTDNRASLKKASKGNYCTTKDIAYFCGLMSTAKICDIFLECSNYAIKHTKLETIYFGNYIFVRENSHILFGTGAGLAIYIYKAK